MYFLKEQHMSGMSYGILHDNYLPPELKKRTQKDGCAAIKITPNQASRGLKELTELYESGRL